MNSSILFGVTASSFSVKAVCRKFVVIFVVALRVSHSAVIFNVNQFHLTIALSHFPSITQFGLDLIPRFDFR
jgi:hypothetical protein